LENGANINVRDENGTTALMNAVIGGHSEVVRVLLQHGADPNIGVGKDNDGNAITALSYARYKKDPEIIRLLEEVNAR
jgi:ankyrin repeat protein